MTRYRLTVPEGNPRFTEIVRGHLDIDPIAHADADKVFAHLAGDMRQDFMPVGQRHPKHRPGQNLRHRAY